MGRGELEFFSSGLCCCSCGGSISEFFVTDCHLLDFFPACICYRPDVGLVLNGLGEWHRRWNFSLLRTGRRCVRFSFFLVCGIDLNLIYVISSAVSGILPTSGLLFSRR